MVSPDEVVVFCLHYLGGSGREWKAVADTSGHGLSFVSIDLAGFGESADRTGFSVDDMALQVLTVVRASGARNYVLAGHSMGGKVAMAVARIVEDQQSSFGLIGMVLIAGSPPSPEPMDEDRREKMKSWFQGDARSNLAEAAYYIEQNISKPIDSNLEEQAIKDVLRMNRDAWLAWLNRGSREDWSARIGILQTQTLLVTGGDDEDLGSEAQSRLTKPHLVNAEMVTIPNVKHLLPIEAPEKILHLIKNHARLVQKQSS